MVPERGRCPGWRKLSNHDEQCIKGAYQAAQGAVGGNSSSCSERRIEKDRIGAVQQQAEADGSLGGIPECPQLSLSVGQTDIYMEANLNQKMLIVDFENVQQFDLSQLDENYQVVIVTGSGQKSVPVGLVASAQKLGGRLEWQRVEGNGKNALDFYIAFKLGRLIEKSPSLQCIVLSKDKGFDPLIQFINKDGMKCKRINSILELEHNKPISGESNYNRVLKLLRNIDKKARPRKRATLSQHISSLFQKNISQSDIDRIIELLIINKMISESNNTIIYGF